MDHEELMTMVYQAISAIQDGKVAEVEIRREWAEYECVEVVLRAEVLQHHHHTFGMRPADDED